MAHAPFLSRVVMRNYKSIAQCDVRPARLCFLVGQNGSGKSNFLDGLRFVSDSLRTSLEHALRERGGVKEVRRRSAGHPTHFGVRLEFSLATGQGGSYAFRISDRAEGGFEVQQEECRVHGPGLVDKDAWFRVDGGKVEGSVPVMPSVVSDRLYLVNASGLPEFRPVYDALSRMGFYNLNPDRMRDLQAPDAGEVLARDGSNLASMLGRLAAHHPGVKQRIEEYLAKVVPGVRGFDTKPIGPKETIEFRQSIAGAEEPWRFLAGSMSDGTLRVLGILVALFQSVNGTIPPVPLVGIEEPEVALHPAAAGLLLDGLRDGSERTQVLVTSHSPDLLGDDELPADSILTAVAEGGVTRLARLDEAGRSALRDRLYTAGEMMRLNQLAPEEPVTALLRQAVLFENEDPR